MLLSKRRRVHEKSEVTDWLASPLKIGRKGRSRRQIIIILGKEGGRGFYKGKSETNTF